MKYSYPVHTLPIMPGILGMIGHGWAWMNFQGAIAMSKSFSGADLFGMETPTKRTNDRPEAAAVVEVLRALRASPVVAWAQRQNTGAAKVGNRFIRFGWPGCADILGQLSDGRFLAVEVKAPTGKPSTEQSLFLARINQAGGLGFVARNCRDVLNNLKNSH